MQSRSCYDRPSTCKRPTGDYEDARKQQDVYLDTAVARVNEATDRGAAQEKRDNSFVAQEDDFLDAVSIALNQLALDCKNALQWSHDEAYADAAIQVAEQSFCTIASICKEAGIAVGADYDGDMEDVAECWNRKQDFFPSSISLQRINTPSQRNSELQSQEIYSDVSLNLQPLAVQVRESVNLQPEAAVLSPTEEMVEVELTDLLTQSHEEMLSLQCAFEHRMSEAERAREDFEHKHADEMRSLQEEMASSRSTMDCIKQEILDNTTLKLEDMHSVIMASQRSIEAGLKDQARYWKAICQELVVEKRDMAQRVAEERGKYTALKAHLASYDEASTKPALNVRTAESVSDSSSREVSPTHSTTSSSSTSKTGRPTFRRYYLAQKRENRLVLQ